MKELLRQTHIPSEAEGLTNLPQTPYSKDGPRFDRGGDILMAEPVGEGRPMGVDEATRRLENAARQGQIGSEETRQGIRQPAAEAGGAGGRDREPPDPPVGGTPEAQGEEGDGGQEPPFTDPILINIIEGIGRMDENNPVYSEFLRNQIKRIEALQDTGRVNPQEASRLQDSLYARLGEVQSQAQTSRERAGGEAQREEEDWRTEAENRARQIYDDLVNEQLGLTEVGVGITDETLRRRIELDKQFFKGNPPDRVGELEKAKRRVEGLTREPIEGETPDEKNEKDRIFLAEKNRVAQRLEALAGRVKNAIAILGGKETRESAEGVFGDRKLSYEEKERIRSAKTVNDIEDLFNRVFDRVDRRPNAEFNSIFGTVGAYEYDEFMRVINSEITKQAGIGDLDRINELEKIVARLSNERAAREIIHNAYFAVITAQKTEAVSNFMTSFLTGYADLAFNKAGVVQAMHFYEQALLTVREKNGGYLPAKEVIGNLKTNEGGEVNIITEDLLREANESGEIAIGREGNPRKLAEWELKRALSFARGMFVVTGRSIEIAATSILPGVESGSSVYIDLFAQSIIQEIFPFRHADKFITRGKVSRALAYILNRPRKPWTPKELEDFAAMGLTEQAKVLNDLMPEGKERFYSVLNPFEIGSWLSRSGWRIGGDPRNPGETAIKYMMMDENERGWIGTGVIIERERGNLEKLESKVLARKQEGVISLGKIENALEQTARVTPLRFFLNIREFKERVLKDLLENDYYFSKDEKRAINDEINKRFEAKERARKEEDEKDAELLRKKGVNLEEKDAKEEEMRKKEARDKITFEEVMRHPRFSKDIKDLILLQEKALLTKDQTLIVGGVKEGRLVEAQSKLGKIFHDTFLNSHANVMKRKDGTYLQETFQQMFLRRLKDKGWKTPFIFGTEDIPYQKYVFEETGARSGSRRWADAAAAAKAGQAFGELLNGLEGFTEQGQIVEAMYKIHHNIRDYNEESAQRFSQSLAEGIMKFYAKTWTHRLPLGIGTANSMIGGNSSYAQIAFGRDKMAWDETNLNEFTRLVRNRGMNTVEQQHKLQERAGGDKKGVIWDSARTMLPLIMIALAIYMMSETTKRQS